MGVDFAVQSKATGELFAVADTATGLPISRFMREGPQAELTNTRAAQPAIVAASLAALQAVTSAVGPGWKPRAVAGHSVGELAACAAVGVFTAADAFRLVEIRARAMADACQAVPGGMAAVLGLELEALEDICHLVSTPESHASLANVNAPGQYVISGETEALARASKQAMVRGAKRVIPLAVEGPFHSSYMNGAQQAVVRALSSMAAAHASVPVIANLTACPIQAAEDIVCELSEQVTGTVQWLASIQQLARLGCDRFVELGQGQVLAGLVRRILPEAQTVSCGRPEDVPAAVELISRNPDEQ